MVSTFSMLIFIKQLFTSNIIIQKFFNKNYVRFVWKIASRMVLLLPPLVGSSPMGLHFFLIFVLTLRSAEAGFLYRRKAYERIFFADQFCLNILITTIQTIKLNFKDNYSPEVSVRLVPIVHVAPSENPSTLLSAFFYLPFRHLTVHCTRVIYWLLLQPTINIWFFFIYKTFRFINWPWKATNLSC